MTVKLELVREKKGFLDHFTYPKILGTFLLLIALPTFFIIPFANNTNWYFTYFFALFFLFVFSWIIMFLKFFTSYDYDLIGKLILTDEKLTILFLAENREFNLIENKIKFLYNGIRKRGFHFGRDYPRSGIAEIIINDTEKYSIIIHNYSDMEALKGIFKTWYRKKFSFEEYTRTKENYRLIELEKDFYWARLTEIKENATNTHLAKKL